MPSTQSVPRLSSSSPSTPEAASLDPAPGEAAVSILLAQFADIPDPRASGGIRHPLSEVLLCALFAVISNCDSYTAMATFAETQLTWLRRYIPLLRGAPSHDTFRYVFMLLQPAAIMDILTTWAGSLDGLHVRIDGKVSRGAKDTETGRSRLWLLRAWVSGAGLSVGQAACGEKSSELATLPALLARLQLKGAMVTIDAMAGHPHIARLLHEGGAGYILALKGNEKETHTLVAAHFKHLSGQKEHPPEGMEEATELFAPEIMPAHWAAPCDVSLTTEMNRGRWEERQVIAIAVGDWLPKAFLWYGLQSAVCVLRRTMRQRQSAAAPAWEVHYYLSSLPPEAAKLAIPIRAHWGVENSCHHLLDVTFREDHCQVRDAAAAQSLSLVREMAGALLKKHPLKGSIKGKRQRAALSQNFRAEVVAANFDNRHA
jgi:predicted transposase YbfD/YdcC